MTKGTRRRILLAFWLIVIFGLSSIPALPGDYAKLPPGFDKLAHFVEYSVLAVLLHQVLMMNGRRNQNLIALVVVIICIAIAGLDEIYQSLIPGRQSSITDLYADLAGIITGTFVSLMLYRRGIPRADVS